MVVEHYQSDLFRRERFHCAPDEVHIWRIVLDVPVTDLRLLEGMLSQHERHKANTFRSRLLRDRWTVARGALRCVLSGYVQARPSTLEFQTTRLGRPHLSFPATNIAFNLSHTRGVAFVAVSGDGRIGIDAEHLYPITSVERIAQRFFDRFEADEILRLPAEARAAAFFACWSRKEAFLKALGKGLQVPLNSFRVSVRPDETPRLVSMSWNESSAWRLADISEPGIAATVAIDWPTLQIRYFEFSIQSHVN